MTDAPDGSGGETSADDARAFRTIIFWIVGCALLGALFLIFAIWVDWV